MYEHERFHCRDINSIQMAEELDENILESLRMILELCEGLNKSME